MMKHIPGVIQITRYCSERCVFCSVVPKLYQPSTETLKKQITTFYKEGVTELTFAGGEPTSNKDLFELIKFARSLGFNEVNIQSNGIRLATESYVDKLIEAGLTRLSISFHSYIPETYKEITQHSGGYTKALQAFRNLQKRNFPTGLNITINSLNYKHLKSHVEYMYTNFPFLHFYSINYCDFDGLALQNPWIVPRLSDVEPYLYQALDYLKANNIRFMVDMVPLCYLQRYELHSVEVNRVKNEEPQYFQHFKVEGDTYYDKNESLLQVRSTQGSTGTVKNSAACKVCGLSSLCLGLNHRYIKLHGDSELFPVFNRIEDS